MDFKTRPIDRKTLRFLAKIIRKNLGIQTIDFPVLKILEAIEFISNDSCNYVVESDELFSTNVMAYIEYIEGMDKFSIHIKESVYINAYKGDHSAIGFIMHEIAHYFLIDILGLKPIDPLVSYSTGEIPSYLSAEWQAMALSGELMIPYDECYNMSFNEVYYLTKSSKKQTEYFFKNVLKKDITI